MWFTDLQYITDWELGGAIIPDHSETLVVSVLRQLEWLFQTWQTADVFVLNKPQQEYGSKMPHPLTDSSWTPNVEISH